MGDVGWGGVEGVVKEVGDEVGGDGEVGDGGEGNEEMDVWEMGIVGKRVKEGE